MANIAPCSTITLYSNVPITNGQQLAFKKVADQTAYFASKKISGHESTNCTYVRRTGQLKIQDKMGIMLQCNYFSFKNGNADFENKTIYCRVTDFSYINNNTVLISYVVDWFQTFMFDVTYESAVLEREHLSVTDWGKVNTNPYDPSVYEMWTPEDLPVDKSMEKVYTSGSPMVHYGQAGYTGMPDTQDCAYTFYSNPVIVVFVSDYDTNEVGTDFFDYFDAYIDSEGNIHRGTNFTNCTPTFQACFLDSNSQQLTEVDVPVPRAVNIGFFACSGTSPYPLNLGAMKNFINGMTYQGLTCQIIGMYQVNEEFIKAFVDTVDGGANNTYYGFKKPNPKDATNTVVTNKKLMFAPFSYLRIETTNGDVKELHFEDFKDLQDSGTANYVNIHMLATLDGLPQMDMIPENYKYKFTADSHYSTINLNIDERLTYGAFPQIGFTTDAYLTYLSNQYIGNLQNRTTGSEDIARSTSSMGVLKSMSGYFSGIVGGGLTGALKGGNLGPAGAGVGALVGAGSGIVSGMLNYQIETQKDANLEAGYDNANVLRNVGGEAASAIASGDRPDAVYDEARAGYVADQYHAGSSGTLPYYLGMRDASTIKFTRVMLKPVFYGQYDAYFTKYGYKSSRNGIPRICYYMQNSSSNPNLPKFLLQQNGQYETYVKCQQIDVKSTMKPVSDFIEAMFRNGMRFIDGSSLLS